jgi:hypothetical protein
VSEHAPHVLRGADFGATRGVLSLSDLPSVRAGIRHLSPDGLGGDRVQRQGPASYLSIMGCAQRPQLGV